MQPRLSTPVRFFAITHSVSDEGTNTTSLGAPFVIFADVIQRPVRQTDKQNPRQLMDVSLVIRDNYQVSAGTHRVELFSRMFNVSLSSPHSVDGRPNGYTRLTLQEIA